MGDTTCPQKQVCSTTIAMKPTAVVFIMIAIIATVSGFPSPKWGVDPRDGSLWASVEGSDPQLEGEQRNTQLADVLEEMEVTNSQVDQVTEQEDMWQRDTTPTQEVAANSKQEGSTPQSLKLAHPDQDRRSWPYANGDVLPHHRHHRHHHHHKDCEGSTPCHHKRHTDWVTGGKLKDCEGSSPCHRKRTPQVKRLLRAYHHHEDEREGSTPKASFFDFLFGRKNGRSTAVAPMATTTTAAKAAASATITVKGALRTLIKQRGLTRSRKSAATSKVAVNLHNVIGIKTGSREGVRQQNNQGSRVPLSSSKRICGSRKPLRLKIPQSSI